MLSLTQLILAEDPSGRPHFHRKARALLLSCDLESSDENSDMTYMLSSPCMRQLEYACEFHPVYNVYLAGGST